MNSLRERILGTLLTLSPNRKFAATKMLMTDVSLVNQNKQGAALVRSNAVFVWSYYLRLLLLSSRRGRERTYARIVVHGEENLRTAAARGKGILLLSVHLGDFDLGGGWLAERCGITPVVCTRPLRPLWRDELFSAARRRLGVVLRDPNDTGIETLEADLHRNRALLVMLDRRPLGAGSSSRILDRQSVAPRAVGLLAARSGASLVAAATWRRHNGETVIWFGEPGAATGPDQAMAQIATAGDHLSQLIRTFPEQWHVPADLREIAWPLGIELRDTDESAASDRIQSISNCFTETLPSD